MTVSIVRLGEAAELGDGVGAKARALSQLMTAGFDVPDGWVVTSAALYAALAATGQRERVTELLGSLTAENVASVAAELSEATAALTLSTVLPRTRHDHAAGPPARSGPPRPSHDVRGLLDPDIRYAVRSSGAREDTDALSFAGQYLTRLNVPADQVGDAVLEVYRSTFSEPVLTYLVDHGIRPSATDFAVVVQEMVPADVSGIAFTVNPLTGADTEIVIEAASGLGEDLVSGRVHASRTVHDWYAARTVESGTLLTPAEERSILGMALAIQRHYGFPCDIEWAIADGRLRVLQARPITRIHYGGIADEWSTADFKDGGVSSTVCTPFMWSLYSFIWERHLRRFMLTSRLLQDHQIRQLGDMFFGRPYWNLSVVKAAMATAPGYRERQFDEELGVRITYDGDGDTTPTTPLTLARIARVALRQAQIVRRQRDTVADTRAALLATAATYEAWLATPRTSAADLERTWLRLVLDDYDRSEGTYFWQIFINTIHQALTKDALVAVVGQEGYFRLISGLDQVSHLRPFYDAWALSRTIHADPEALAYWTARPTAEIAADLDAGSTAHHLDGVRRLIADHGYHSVRELDVTHPDFDTDHAAVVQMVRDTVGLDDSYAPDADRARLRAAYEAELERAERTVGPFRARALRRRVERTRRMLWWREELRDTSTRFYHLIRLTTLRLADALVAAGALERTDDIWFLTIDDLRRHLGARRQPGLPLERRATPRGTHVTIPLPVNPDDGGDLRALVARNRAYYESFRNHQPPNEIGVRFDRPSATATAVPCTGEGEVPAATGVGASPGVVEGTARVIESLQDIDRVQPGDILVTKFTDTGWTGKFALISGIVTEYGGILTHAAIVSREYGIPCIVACHGVMSAIPDGARVRVDGSRGEVWVL